MAVNIRYKVYLSYESKYYDLATRTWTRQNPDNAPDFVVRYALSILRPCQDSNLGFDRYLSITPKGHQCFVSINGSKY